jgi:hypothetical protein
VGVDVQGDRLEATVVGWGRDGEALVLGHLTLWGGHTDHDEVWRSLEPQDPDTADHTRNARGSRSRDPKGKSRRMVRIDRGSSA